MSFPTNSLKTQPIKQTHKNYRKEKDSSLTNHFIKILPIQSERASTFASKGSITLEAAVVIPIFFFAVLCLVYLLEMMAIQTTLHHAMHSVGKEIAQAAYSSPMISTYGIEQHLIKTVGEERLNKSMIAGGAKGLDCSKSRSDWNTTVMDLSVCYDLEIPVLFFRIPVLSREETLRVKGWTGYVAGANGAQKEEVVYVTDYGLVYHQDMYCTYLELSIKAVRPEDVESLRNQTGGKYSPCEYCGGKEIEGNRMYVTDYGDRYHGSLDCSRIKRNIYAVPLNEVYGLGGCSKCVK